MKISDLLKEVSLGDYTKKAKMGQALDKMSMAFGGNQSPEEKARLQHKIDRREAGLGRAKVRTDKAAATMAAQRQAEYEQGIRDKYAGVDIDAEIAKLQPALKSAYNDYQYGARNTWSQGKAEYDRLSAKVQELERAKKILGGEAESASVGGTSTASMSTAPGKRRPDSIVV